MARLALAAALCVSWLGCAGAGPLESDAAPRLEAPLDVYFSGEEPARCYVARGEIHANAASDLDATLTDLSTQARSLGADGVLVKLRVGEAPRGRVDATAIRYSNAAPADPRCHATGP